MRPAQFTILHHTHLTFTRTVSTAELGHKPLAGEMTSRETMQLAMNIAAARSLTLLQKETVLQNVVNRSLDAAAQSAPGLTVNVAVPGRLVAQNLYEQGNYTNQSYMAGVVPLVLDQHPIVALGQTDMAKAASNLDLLDQVLQPGVQAIVEHVETTLAKLYPLATRIAPVGTAGSTANLDATIDAAERALYLQSVPAAENKFLIVDPVTYSVIRNMDKFSRMDSIGSSSAITNGRVGTLYDFTVIRSQYVQKTSGPTTTWNMALSSNAIVLAFKTLPRPDPNVGVAVGYATSNGFSIRVMKSFNHQTMTEQLTMDALYGCTVYDPRRIVIVKT